MRPTRVVAGKYEIVSSLGEGGMGTVYEAKNRVTGRHVALKILNKASLGCRETNERFLREARATAQIESQHIAHVLDAGADEGEPYIVLELLRGSDLAELIAKTKRLDPKLALRIVGQACAGLAKAH